MGEWDEFEICFLCPSAQLDAFYEPDAMHTNTISHIACIGLFGSVIVNSTVFAASCVRWIRCFWVLCMISR